MTSEIERLINLLPSQNLSLGYRELNFIRMEEFDELQIGYRIDPNGKSLISKKKGAWRDEWFVIATDEMGDPVIVDTKSFNNTIYTSEHGQGKWELTCIADNILNFIQIIKRLEEISINRSNPVGLEENPILDHEKEELLKMITDTNKNVELWYWELWFEQENNV